MVTVGKVGGPVDSTDWDALCMRRLGRKVPFGEKLTPAEWQALGYLMAANDPKARSSYWLGLSNVL